MLERSDQGSGREIWANFRIFKIFKIFENLHFYKKISKDPLKIWGGWVGSTSPPGGNLVDGLPPASSNTVARSSKLDVKKMLTYL